MKVKIGHVDGIELNRSPEEELDQEVGLGPERARRIVENRPFRSWDEVKQLEGFTAVIVDDLQAAGAQLGDPELADSKPISDAHRHELELTATPSGDLDESLETDGERGPNRRAS